MRLFHQFKLGELDQDGKQLAERLFARRPPWAVASISVRDAAHLVGLVRSVQPTRIVEVGVASGWGSVVVIEALRSVGVEAFDYLGVDTSERFFHDTDYATGQAVNEVVPEYTDSFSLITGKSVGQVISEVSDKVEFAFIDAHHMHPWATLDLLAILPKMADQSWVALHDLNLCRIERHKHRNRGPKYLFEGWVGDKIHSTENPTMIGAIKIESDPEEYLDSILDTLYTPWEIAVKEQYLNPILDSIKQHYGGEWALKFEKALERGNHQLSKENNREIAKLTAEVTRLKSVVESTSRDVLEVLNGVFGTKSK